MIKILRRYKVEIISILDEEILAPIFEEIRINSNAKAQILINKNLKFRRFKSNKDYKIDSIRLKPTLIKKYMNKKK